MDSFQIAIDGPAGSGKSSISKALANKLGFKYLDTGAMYRAVTLEALEKGINLENEKEYSFLQNFQLKFVNQRIHIRDVDVSKEIRMKRVTENVSLVSSLNVVRKKMVELQKRFALNCNCILDGRDIGTVVLPKAKLKIYLTADIEERAKRRIKESYKNESLENMINKIKIRDYKDSSRDNSPLIISENAMVIDTTYLTEKEVLEKILKEYNKRK